MTTPHRHEAPCDRAALYALGILAPDQARAFEAHLEAGCLACAGELTASAPVLEHLAYAAPPQAPPPALRAAVLERVAASRRLAEQPVIDEGGLRFVRTGGLAWDPGAVPGLSLKPLHVDTVHGRVTTLVRMAPGTPYPAHRHAGVEELHLLEGDLLVSGVLMRAGDYCRAEPDTVHRGVSTPNGCVFLVTTSVHDQLLA